MPMVKGLTSGFLRMPCMAAPDTANPAPATMAMAMRGNLRLQTTVSASSLACIPVTGNSLEITDLSTSRAVMEAAPPGCRNDAKKQKNHQSENRKQNFFQPGFCLSVFQRLGF